MAHSRENGSELPSGYLDVAELLERLDLRDASSEAIVDALTLLLLQAPASIQTRQTLIDYMNMPLGTGNSLDVLDTKVRGLIHLIMCTPAYQLS